MTAWTLWLLHRHGRLADWCSDRLTAATGDHPCRLLPDDEFWPWARERLTAFYLRRW